MNSPRQTLIDIIMKSDEDNEQELEFLESLTLKELADLADNVQEPEDEL
jgi:hypothetical protein